MENSKANVPQQCFPHSSQQGKHDKYSENSRELPWNICYKVGEARVFPEQNCIMQPDNTYSHVRPKSFSVLVYLCENSGRLISKDHLIKAVWGNICVTDDSLVQCIVDIRRNLGAKNGKILRTVTRLGYMLHAEKLVNKGACNKATTVLVGPFSSTTKEPDTQLAKALCDTVTMRLIQKQGSALHLARNQDHEHVDFHLLGNLQIHKNQTRVLLLLLNVALGEYIWSKSYQHSHTDTFVLQDSLAESIVNDTITKLFNTNSDKSGEVIDLSVTN